MSKKKDENIEKDDRNKHIILVTVLVVLLMGVSFAMGYAVGGVDIINGVKEGNVNVANKEESDEKNDGEIDDSVKKKLDRFIKVGSYWDAANPIATNFNKGITGLTDELKLKMAFISVVKVDTKVSWVKEVPEKYKNNQQIYNEYWKDEVPLFESGKSEVQEMSTKDFEDAYLELFGEKPVYTIDTLIDVHVGCPMPLLMDEDSGKIYLYYRCGGSSQSTYIFDTIRYDSDGEYYYVYQRAGFKKEGEDYAPHTLVWKFDLEGNFVSSSSK